MSDIRKWFMKHHDKGNSNAAKPAAAKTASDKPSATTSETQKAEGQESAARRKTSKYFDKDQEKPKIETQKVEVPAKRKTQKGDEDSHVNTKPSPAKKVHKVEEKDDDDDDFAPISSKKKLVDATPSKRLKGSSGRGIAKKNVVVDESSDEEMDEDKETKTPVKSAGRGRGRGAESATPAGGRGRGRGRGGFMNFGERKDPPHKGEKEVPEGTPDCLAGLTFVISGTLDSLEREEAEDLIKRHGGRVTGTVSKKTNFLLCDEDIGGRKSEKATELGTPFLTEDGLLDMIRASKKSKSPALCNSKKPSESTPSSSAKKIPQNVDLKKADVGIISANSKAPKSSASSSPAKKKDFSKQGPSLTWTEKYKPKVPNDIVGNQKLVKDLHDWLSHWDDQFSHNNGKRKRQSNSAEKKAVLMSGTPGIGKTTSAKLVSKMLNYDIIEVNASDSRGKADSQIGKGIGGSTANSIKVLISNKSLGDLDRSKHPKTVLIMDEVDGMSAGDRGGVADLIASIKISKVPIICICNDRYSQKLKSLVNYCTLYNFRKPTKQQMAKRLLQIANAEGLQVNEIALEELAERCNGDMRMALNQLQYMSLSMSVIRYDDIRQRLLSSAKDEDISPFTAVDKLFGFNGGKLRMDERIDLSMSDLDLVPLLIQENYINYRPSSLVKDDGGMKRMSSLARVAESIADGDIINVQIRRYRQWQLSQSSCVSSCIVPAALMHGQRETFMPGERNFNRFGGWLGKNSTMGKNLRILEDLHVHMLASSDSYLGRGTLRLDFLTLLSKKLTEPLRVLPKEEAVKKVVEFMDAYSLSMEDYDTLMELSKFQGHPTPNDGILPAVKAALTKGYKEGSSSRVVRTADMITLPGLKKAPKKRIAAILEPVDELGVVNGDINEEYEEENAEDTEDLDDANGAKKLKLDLESNHAKGIQVQVDLKGAGSSGTKKTQKASTGRGKGGIADPASGKRGGRGSGTAARRKK